MKTQWLTAKCYEKIVAAKRQNVDGVAICSLCTNWAMLATVENPRKIRNFKNFFFYRRMLKNVHKLHRERDIYF